jgi:hypothetical protein
VLAYKEYIDEEYRFVSALFLAPADGSQAAKVELPGEPQRFAWSPSGRWIAVLIGGEPRNKLAIVDASRALVVRTIDLPWAAYEVLWSPDDARILLRAFNDRELAIATTNGGPVARIATPGRSAVIGWMKGPLPRAAPKASRPPPVELATIVLWRRSDGALRRFRPPGGAIDAELERVGLYYGYNLRRAKFPGRVAFIPFRALFSR